MNEIFISITYVSMGIVIGALALDWAHRRAAIGEMKQAKQSLQDSAGKLSGLHNELTQKIIELEERVAAHDYQLTARVKPKPQWGDKPK